MSRGLPAYQANTLSKAIREGANDIDGWTEPLGPALIQRPYYLLVKDGENGGMRAACLELGGKAM